MWHILMYQKHINFWKPCLFCQDHVIFLKIFVNLIQFDPIWFNLNQFDPIWSIVIQLDIQLIFWSYLHVKKISKTSKLTIFFIIAQNSNNNKVILSTLEVNSRDQKFGFVFRCFGIGCWIRWARQFYSLSLPYNHIRDLGCVIAGYQCSDQKSKQRSKKNQEFRLKSLGEANFQF